MQSMSGAWDPGMVKHISSISARGESETDRLVSAMFGRCWPGGPDDRADRGALEWVRRWGPRRVAPLSYPCSCAAGRCRVCN